MAMKDGLYKTPGGKYFLYHVWWRGQQRKGSTKKESRTAAKKWLKSLMDQWADEEVGLYEAPALTLLEAYTRWHRLQKHQVVPAYLEQMRVTVNAHAAAYLEQPLTALDNAAIEEIRAAYLESGTGRHPHSLGGARTLVKMLNALMGWCVEQKLIKARPFTPKKRKVQEKKKAVLWPEQIQAFLAEADRGGPKALSKKPQPLPHSATALRMLIGLGLREDECLSARWRWLDRRRKVFVVEEAKNRALREVPVPAWLMAHLVALGEREGCPSNGLILPAGKDAEGNSIPHRRGFTRSPTLRCGAQLEVWDLTPHCLRATWATGHFETGTTLSQIQQMMGHADPSTTMKYIAQRPKDQAEAQENTAKAMGFPVFAQGLTFENQKKRLSKRFIKNLKQIVSASQA